MAAVRVTDGLSARAVAEREQAEVMRDDRREFLMPGGHLQVTPRECRISLSLPLVSECCELTCVDAHVGPRRDIV
jgi:hypothetical protein